MKLKELLEKTNDYTIVKLILYKHKICKQFVSTVYDILHNEQLWLDKEVNFIELAPGEDEDDLTVKLRITLKTEQKT